MPCFSVLTQHVVSEILDGESIIMDFRSGMYFSADNIGAIIWDGLAAGFDTAAIEQRIRDASSGDPQQIAADVREFTAALVTNKLVQESDAPSAPTGWTVPLPTVPIVYVKPELTCYGDMRDLAMLDPVHDVPDDAGWPNRKTAF